MAMKAIFEGNAGDYRLRGAIWELGTSAYRAYVHLVPAGRRKSRLSPSVVSAEGKTVQQVLGAAEERVKSTVGRPVENLEVIPGTSSRSDTDRGVFGHTQAVRRYPEPTD